MHLASFSQNSINTNKIELGDDDFDTKMVVTAVKLASKFFSKVQEHIDDNSFPKTVVFDWFTLIRITGLRCVEYAQKTQTNVDEHEYASGKHVIKAFVPSDWKFYNSKGRLITDPMEVPTKLKMTFFNSKK